LRPAHAALPLTDQQTWHDEQLMGHGQTSEEPPLLREAEAWRLDRLPDVDERMAARFCVCSRWA